jgi:prepilin-type N-terminal cleavage/methylation domain-containing protein
MMILSTACSPLGPSAPRQRRGLSLIEVMVAVMILGITMTFVGHISTGIAQSNRKSDIIAKRTFAMQQQANVVGALPFASLTTTILPPTKNFTLGDFSYTRRVALTKAGNASVGQTATIAITIVPQTGIPSDTLLQETLTMYRSSPLCGTALGIQAC